MNRITAVIENAGQVLTCAPDAPDLVGARKNTVVAVSGKRSGMGRTILGHARRTVHDSAPVAVPNRAPSTYTTAATWVDNLSMST